MPSPFTSAQSLRKVIQRAIDLLVIGFVVLFGLSAGPQLIEWWRTDPSSMTPDLSNLSGEELDWSRTPIAVRFGDAAISIERIPLEGDQQRLIESLTELAQSIVTSSEAPAAPPTQAEQEWLKSLRSAVPVIWDSTLGNVYLQHAPLHSFVATRYEEIGINDDEARQRVVSWGVAFPSTADRWMIYAMRPVPSLPDAGVQQPSFPLPDGARRISEIRGTNGCAWTVFQGRGDLQGWIQLIDCSIGKKFIESKSIRNDLASVQYRQADLTTDVEIRRESDGTLTGVAWSRRTQRPQDAN